MSSDHEEYNSNDGWTSEDDRLLDNVLTEFGQVDTQGDTNKEETNTSKKRRVTKRPRARAIPWTEEEHK